MAKLGAVHNACTIQKLPSSVSRTSLLPPSLHCVYNLTYTHYSALAIAVAAHFALQRLPLEPGSCMHLAPYVSPHCCR